MIRELFTHNCDAVTEGQAPWTAQRGASSNRDGWEDSQAGGSLWREGSTVTGAQGLRRTELQDGASWAGHTQPKVPGAARAPGSSRRGLRFAREEGGSARVVAWGRGTRKTHRLFRGTDSAGVASCGTGPPRGRGTEGSAVRGRFCQTAQKVCLQSRNKASQRHGQGQGNSRSS